MKLFSRTLILSLALMAINAIGAERCKYKAPLPISLGKNTFFKNYSLRKTDTDTTENGELKDGTLFNISRGGCTDYGESLSFEFASGGHQSGEVSYWLRQISKNLKILIKGNEDKTGALSAKAEALEKLAGDKKLYKYGDTIKVEGDTFEIYVEEARKGRITSRVEITTPL